MPPGTLNAGIKVDKRTASGLVIPVSESDSTSAPQPSPLAAEHRRLGARMAPFAGWEMPIQYAGIVAEHQAVRESCGVFDISHMGQFRARGENAAAWLNSLLTNDIGKLGDGEGQYTLMLNERGGVIDDLILYRTAPGAFFLVVNASKIEEDFAWLRGRLREGVDVANHSDAFGGLAIQGPDAAAVWEKMSGGTLELPPRNGILEGEIGASAVTVCRTGYTGEDGFELFSSTETIAGWFAKAIDGGATPCGLGARDTLRLEKCYPLNGSDLDPDHTPLEAGLGFFVKLDKDADFTGKSVLEGQKTAGLRVRLSAIRQTQKGPPPRHGYEVFEPGGERPVAVLTSGSLSPTLGWGIGLAYLPASLARAGTPLEIEIRGRRFSAEVVKKPFV